MKVALLIFAAISSPSLASDECNGLNIMGLMTWSADVCLNAMENGAMTSHTIECDENGEGIMNFWNTGDCEGDAFMSMSLSVMFEDGMSFGMEMICDGVDCPYAKVRSHDLNDTDTLIMEPGFEYGSEDSSEDEFGYGTTDDPNWWDTTEMQFGSGSSSEEDWAAYIDCDANEFENWEETAVALNECIGYSYNNTGYFVDYVCQDGEFTMEYHDTEDCSGSALHSEPHFAHEGICPLVECPSATSSAPETTESTLFECPSEQLEGHFDENQESGEASFEIELEDADTVYIGTCDSQLDTVISVYDQQLETTTSYDDDNCGWLNEDINVFLGAGRYTISVDRHHSVALNSGYFHLKASLCPLEYDSATSTSAVIAVAVALVVSLLG